MSHSEENISSGSSITSYDFAIEKILKYSETESTDTAKINQTNNKFPLLIPVLPKFLNNGADSLKSGGNGNKQIKNANNLKGIAERYFITRNLFSFLMTEQGTTKEEVGVKSKSYFDSYAGKRITSIRFKRLDPFGPTLYDTTKVATDWIGKTANQLHMNTTKKKLRMQLLFKEGEMVNPLLMAENEKIIRDLPFIEDVAILIVPSKIVPDEVEIIIITKDRFEYGFVADISPSHSDIELFNENMFGMGHHIAAGITTNNNIDPKIGAYAIYKINNIDGKFINLSVSYFDTFRKKSWILNADKNFISSETDYAGGVYIEKAFRNNFITDQHPIRLDTPVSYFISDYWMGFILNPERNADQCRNTLFGRYMYQEFSTDQFTLGNKFIRDHHFFMTSFSNTKRNLFKNNLVYSFGVTEDIPYGHLLELKAGIDRSQFGNWPYLGVSFTKASILKDKAYFNWQVACDGFWVQERIAQGTILFKTNYFSDLFYVKGNRYRQFANIEFIGGINRYKQEYLTINRKYGIRDFFSDEVRGVNKLRVNLELVKFLNWNYYGFRFANFLYSDFAFLSNDLKHLFEQDFYAGIGVGFRVHNESLVFNVLEIRLSWFPMIPNDGSHFFLNSFGVPKTRFPDFFGQKPELNRFQ